MLVGCAMGYPSDRTSRLCRVLLRNTCPFVSDPLDVTVVVDMYVRMYVEASVPFVNCLSRWDWSGV